jgi:hypothetical protein
VAKGSPTAARSATGWDATAGKKMWEISWMVEQVACSASSLPKQVPPNSQQLARVRSGVGQEERWEVWRRVSNHPVSPPAGDPLPVPGRSAGQREEPLLASPVALLDPMIREGFPCCQALSWTPPPDKAIQEPGSNRYTSPRSSSHTGAHCSCTSHLSSLTSATVGRDGVLQLSGPGPCVTAIADPACYRFQQGVGDRTSRY